MLCSGTLPRSAFPEKVEAASRAGFRGISLFYSDYASSRAQGLSDADLRKLLEDHGLEIAELDPLMNWLEPGSGEPKLAGQGEVEDDRFSQGGESDFYALAEVLGARRLRAPIRPNLSST